MMSPMSKQYHGLHMSWWSLRHDKVVSNDGNDQNNFVGVDLNLVPIKP